MERRRVKLVISFDGTRYAGWQLQKKSASIQGKLEGAVADLFGYQYRVHGSSRTDSGVHALAMAAHVDLPVDMTMRQLPLALNTRLPKDIRVVSAESAPPDFHARKSAVGKQYRYFVWNHPVSNPMIRTLVWHCPKPLDIQAVREAMRLFKGRHDFRAFAANSNREVGSTVRSLRRSEVRGRGPLLTFIMEGDGFLYKMCRALVGTAMDVGLGRFDVEDVAAMLRSRDRTRAGPNAPAQGLVLWEVYY